MEEGIDDVPAEDFVREAERMHILQKLKVDFAQMVLAAFPSFTPSKENKRINQDSMIIWKVTRSKTLLFISNAYNFVLRLQLIITRD